MMPQTLVVVGAGPKGSAIAAKAATLRITQKTGPDVLLIEKNRAGSAWDGRHGYTDGKQLLCTTPDRDLGFPYQPYNGRDNVPAHMAAVFSWNAFCRDRGELANWVARGKPRPTHRLFADYIAWAIDKCASDVPLYQAEVTKIRRYGSEWLVECDNGHQHFFCDGVVVTGGGPEHPPFLTGTPRLFSGLDFWSPTRQLQLNDQIRQDTQAGMDPSVIIIGAGGTAAAVASRLLQMLPDQIPVIIFGTQPTLFARTPNFMEDRLFTDEAAWQDLTTDGKWDFVQRLSVGAVWDNVIHQLGNSDRLIYQSRFVHAVALSDPNESASSLSVSIGPAPISTSRGAVRPKGAATARAEASIVIDARGFNQWEFANRFDDPIKNALLNNKQAIEDGIDHSLMVRHSAIPPGLHLPMHAWQQGAGASNLMALGWMADRILSAY